jgi:hypothetical protein
MADDVRAVRNRNVSAVIPRKPFGDNPMSDSGLIWSSLLSIGLITAVMIFLLNSTLHTEVWTDGIRYKFPPLLRKIRHIPFSEIASVKVEKYSPIMEFGGWGWRVKLGRKKYAYNVSGSLGLRIIKKDGTVIVLGTQKSDELSRAVERMKTDNTEKMGLNG